MNEVATRIRGAVHTAVSHDSAVAHVSSMVNVSISLNVRKRPILAVSMSSGTRR